MIIECINAVDSQPLVLSLRHNVDIEEVPTEAHFLFVPDVFL